MGAVQASYTTNKIDHLFFGLPCTSAPSLRPSSSNWITFVSHSRATADKRGNQSCNCMARPSHFLFIPYPDVHSSRTPTPTLRTKLHWLLSIDINELVLRSFLVFISFKGENQFLFHWCKVCDYLSTMEITKIGKRYSSTCKF